MNQSNSQEKNTQKLLENYLKLRSKTESSEKHLDEDFLSSFVEGRLSQPESTLVLNHLSRCAFCLHVTAELSRLDYEFADNKISAATANQKPEKISDVLSGLLSKIFGTSDHAVFAHQEEKEENEDEEDGK